MKKRFTEEQALAFCLAHQVDATLLENKSEELALAGGFVQSKIRHLIRIDYVQHTVGAITGLFWIRELLR